MTLTHRHNKVFIANAFHLDMRTDDGFLRTSEIATSQDRKIGILSIKINPRLWLTITWNVSICATNVLHFLLRQRFIFWAIITSQTNPFLKKLKRQTAF